MKTKRRYNQHPPYKSVVVRLNRYELAIVLPALEDRIEEIRAQRAAKPTYALANEAAVAESVLLKLEALAALVSPRAA
jgi:hypothetical protein